MLREKQVVRNHASVLTNALSEKKLLHGVPSLATDGPDANHTAPPLISRSRSTLVTEARDLTFFCAE